MTLASTCCASKILLNSTNLGLISSIVNTNKILPCQISSNSQKMSIQTVRLRNSSIYQYLWSIEGIRGFLGTTNPRDLILKVYF